MIKTAIVEMSSSFKECEPVTVARTLGECPIANISLREWQQQRLKQAAERVESNDSNAHDLQLSLRSDAWVSQDIVSTLLQTEQLPVTVRDEEGTALVWLSDADVDGTTREATTLSCDDGESCLIRYPWDLLALNERVIRAMGTHDMRGTVSEKAEIDGCLILGENSRLLPGVYVEGNVVIGRDCKIGPNCYIRGNTAIGDSCRIGQAVEIKNSLIMNGGTIGHLSYCGDSIIGEDVNFGAGTIVANLRHDNSNQRSQIGEELVDTGRRKMGTVVGDAVHTGIHTSIYPGRKIWPHHATRPAEVVQKDIR